MGIKKACLKVTAIDTSPFVGLMVLVCVLFFCMANEVSAKEKNLTVAVEITAPCVMHNNDTYTGFDIELWEEIAQELNMSFTYHETSLKGIFTDLVRGDADVALSCITVTDSEDRINYGAWQ